MEKEKNLSGAILHCISATAFFICAVLLIVFTCINKSALDIIFITIFSFIVFMYFLFSTIYHFTGVTKFFKKFDQILSYLLISTSLLPMFLCILKGAWGWSLFGTVTGLCLTFIIMTSIWTNIPKVISSNLYFSILEVFLIALIPLSSVINPTYTLFFIGIFLYFIAELIDLFSFKSTKYKSFHTLSHILISIACLSTFIFYFIYVLN